MMVSSAKTTGHKKKHERANRRYLAGEYEVEGQLKVEIGVSVDTV